jgi:hypothetical protein
MDHEITPNRKNVSHYLNLPQSKVFNKNLNVFYHLEVPPQLNGPTIIYKGLTFLIGGGIPDYSSCFIVNSIDLHLTQVASLLTGRKKHGLVVHLDEIFAIGGVGQDFLSSVEKFDGKNWTGQASLSHERVEPTCCSANENIYVFGGNANYPLSVERLNKGIWEEIHLKFPILAKRMGSFFFNDWIYLVGGNLMTFRTNATLKEVHIFNVHEGCIEKSLNLQNSDCFDTPAIVKSEKVELIGNNSRVKFYTKTRTWKMEKVEFVCKTCFNHCVSLNGKCGKARKMTLIKLYSKLKPLSKLA